MNYELPEPESLSEDNEQFVRWVASRRHYFSAMSHAVISSDSTTEIEAYQLHARFCGFVRACNEVEATVLLKDGIPSEHRERLRSLESAFDDSFSKAYTICLTVLLRAYDFVDPKDLSIRRTNGNTYQ